ncbi:HemK family protein methyltransferase [Candidatus Nesciobacter abundans]|uniref:peptide chain release factor N(5)-glutamine methyltransferase n=1 Tax=Candidatus Nesciobacter abundans TaxID=2601668 RepID=A0A5C0UGS6_9PROT|nr:HemK family protein methyltransferase [Candidatus Nesciobacter abundans]QEK38871.1 HemK family protein methyltransferase [Candidatus Nesciobacter abundans]
MAKLSHLIQEYSKYLLDQNESIAYISAITNLSRTEIWLNKHRELDEVLGEINLEKCKKAINYVKYGVPLSRITKTRGFWNHDFHVSPYTLDPRPETEKIVELAISLSKKNKSKNILDLGTGTGCIILSILLANPLISGAGVDISKYALLTAKQNAKSLKVNNCTFMHTSEIEENKDQFDIIVCNPPYIHNPNPANLDNPKEPENYCVDYATKFDPTKALFDQDGIQMLNNLPLSENGILLCEVPTYQKQLMEEKFKKNYKWHNTSHREIVILEYLNY